MLETPRSTVTLAAGILHRAGLVDYSRGKDERLRTGRPGEGGVRMLSTPTIQKEFDRLGISSAR